MTLCAMLAYLIYHHMSQPGPLSAVSKAIRAQTLIDSSYWAEKNSQGVAYRKTRQQRGSPACCPAPVTSLGQTQFAIRHALSTLMQHVQYSKLQVTPSLPIVRLPGHKGEHHTTLPHHRGARCRMTAAVSIAIGARQREKRMLSNGYTMYCFKGDAFKVSQWQDNYSPCQRWVQPA